MDQPTRDGRSPRRTWADREAAYRQPRPRRLSGRTVAIGLGAFGMGLAFGLGLFYLGSSRGMDAWRQAETVTFFALVLVLLLSFLALFSAWFTDDGRLLASLIGVVAGASLTTTIGLALIPGTTTDGSATFTRAFETANVQRTFVTCTWADGRVVEVRTRGEVGWAAVGADGPVLDVARVRLDLRTTTVAIAVAEAGHTPVPRETLPAMVTPSDPTGRTGVAGFTGWQIAWSCPQDP